jgi:hypothetical protein
MTGAAVDTVAHLREQLTRLLILRNPPADLTEWETQLLDLPAHAITAAVDQALRTRVFFPLPAEVRADADAAGAGFALIAPCDDRDRERALLHPFAITLPVPDAAPITVHVEREWRYDCDTCSDSGWAEFWCGARPEARQGGATFLPRRRCQRLHTHDAHAWALPCACVECNPTIARRKAAQRQKFSQDAETVGRR